MINTMDKEKRMARAKELHALGYNCAQCVLMSVHDMVGIDEHTAATLSAGLGAGVGRGEICGVANALAIATGLRMNDDACDGKKRVMPESIRLLKEFSAPCGGCITCRDLKGKCGRSCDDLISEGVALLCR